MTEPTGVLPTPRGVGDSSNVSADDGLSRRNAWIIGGTVAGAVLLAAIVTLLVLFLRPSQSPSSSSIEPVIIPLELSRGRYLSEENVAPRYNFEGNLPYFIEIRVAITGPGALVGFLDGGSPDQGMLWIQAQDDGTLIFGRNEDTGVIGMHTTPGLVRFNHLQKIGYSYDGTWMNGFIDDVLVATQRASGRVPPLAQPLSVNALFNNNAPYLPASGFYFTLEIWSSTEKSDEYLVGQFIFQDGNTLFPNLVEDASDVLYLRS